MTLDISLVGGQNYDETADPIYLEETYPMLISPSGTELLIAKGETGICLPFMSRSTTACTLTLIEGQCECPDTPEKCSVDFTPCSLNLSTPGQTAGSAFRRLILSYACFAKVFTAAQ